MKLYTVQIFAGSIYWVIPQAARSHEEAEEQALLKANVLRGFVDRIVVTPSEAELQQSCYIPGCLYPVTGDIPDGRKHCGRHASVMD